MPFPTPKPDEEEKDFLDRCMGDDVMVAEYEDEKQRYKICNDIWRKKDEKKSSEREFFRNLPPGVYLPAAQAELRVLKKDGKPVVVGYFALFNSLSENLGGYNEKIAPGAFKKALRNSPDIKDLFNHDPNFLLGTTKAKTLYILEDERGLAYELFPEDNQRNRDFVLTPIERGELDGNSFGFTFPPNGKGEKWEEPKTENDLPIRTITEVASLLDGSQVTYPAYREPSLALESRAQHMHLIEGVWRLRPEYGGTPPQADPKAADDSGVDGQGKEPKPFDPEEFKQRQLEDCRNFFK